MPRVNLTNALRDEYQQLFDTCVIDANRQAIIERVVDRIATNRTRYEAVGAEVGVPWQFIAIVHNMEASGRFDRHLHNGDPLTRRERAGWRARQGVWREIEGVWSAK